MEDKQYKFWMQQVKMRIMYHLNKDINDEYNYDEYFVDEEAAKAWFVETYEPVMHKYPNACASCLDLEDLSAKHYPDYESEYYDYSGYLPESVGFNLFSCQTDSKGHILTKKRIATGATRGSTLLTHPNECKTCKRELLMDFTPVGDYPKDLYLELLGLKIMDGVMEG